MLLKHNIPAYNELTENLTHNNSCCLVMGTGVGKTYVATEYLTNNNLKALVVSPRHSINDAWQKHSKNIETLTYQKLKNIYKQIDYSKYDVLICDEVHHIGAPTWAVPIRYILNNTKMKVIGLTESTIRYSDGGRDIANEFFNGNVIYGESVSSAIEKQILNPVTYVGAMYNSDGLKKTLSGKIQSRLYAKLNLTLNKTPTITEILKKHMPNSARKGIIFASAIDDIQSAIDFIKSVYPKAVIKFVHSKQSDSINEEVLEWFKNTKEGYICSVDMISEGVHIKGVNTLIMLRRTESVNLFNQQLGRCLDASSKEPAILFDLVNNKYSVRIIKNRLRIRVNSMFKSGALNIVPSNQLIINDYTKDIVSVLEEIQASLDNNWTPEEDEILEKYYKTEFSKISARLPRHTLAAIKKHAEKRGLTNNKHKSANRTPWTPEEIEIVKNEYLNTNTKILAQKLNRGVNTIRHKAKELGLSYHYDREMINEIIELYKQGKTATELLEIFYPKVKNLSNMRNIICSNTSQLKNPRWSENDIQILKEYYPKIGGQVSSMLNNKSKRAIQFKARSLNLYAPGRKTLQPIKIRCVETGEIYESMYQLASVLSIKFNKNKKRIHRNLSQSLKKNNIYYAYGYHWKRM